MVSEANEQNVRWLNDAEMEAWRAYIVGSALLEHRLGREIQASHGLSMADYEILVRLSARPDNRMRMSELADEVAHSKSRTSHQVRRLEKAGLVERVDCASDGRGVLAVLTDKGAEVLRDAAPTHVAGVREHLIDLLDPNEQEVLGSVFTRVVDHLRGIER